MNRMWAFFTFFAVIALCHAQAITITGTVKSSAGAAIEGAMVRLGMLDISTTTGTDGKFTLKDQTGITHPTGPATPGNGRLFTLKNDRLCIAAAEPTSVGVRVYDCNGRRLLTFDKVIASLDNSIALPGFADGVHIYQVSINNNRYTFKSVFGITTGSGPVSSTNAVSPVRLAKTAAEIDDALLVSKAGYQLYRLKVTSSDVSDVQVSLTPFETGTVTDGEGNVYQTLKIGKLFWTIENLRSTKYNDGSAIAQGSYCFYKNATDAAAKKKWGALYNGTTALNSKLAPTGWHVATTADWDTLQNYLIANGYNYDGTLSGNKIAKSMSTATSDWQTFAEEGAIGNNVTKNNASGFSGLPGGLKTFDGDFIDQNVIGYWWTSTKKDGTYTNYRILYYTNFDLYPSYRVNTNFCSIRCVKNN